jgi:hypothetical protein
VPQAYIFGLLIAVLSGGFNFIRMAWILSILLQDPLAALNIAFGVGVAKVIEIRYTGDEVYILERGTSSTQYQPGDFKLMGARRLQ